MASKGKVEADRTAAARRDRARSSIRLAVREAVEAGMSGDEMAKAFAEVLRESGLLATMDDVLKIGRSARKA